MQVWNVLHAARWNTGRKKSPKIPHLGIIAQHRRAISQQLRHISQIEKELVKQQYLPHMSSQYGELRSTSGWDRFVSLIGAPQQISNFNGIRVLASLLQRRRSAEADQTLHDVWPSPGLVHYIHIFGGFCPVTEFWGDTKFTLRPSLALTYIGSVTARHSNSGRQPNFAASSRGRHLCSRGRPSRWALAHVLVLY